MNITILASIGAKNLGDELILKNEIILLKKQFAWKNPVFAVFTYDTKNIFYKKNNIEYLEYFPIWIKNPKNFFKNLKNFFVFLKTILVADLVVIGWGWIFFDNENSENNTNLAQWNFRTKIIRFFKKNILFWWIWINIKQEKNLKILKKIFSWAYNVTVRDIYSKGILDKIWINSKIIKDPVFFDNLEKNIPHLNPLLLSKRKGTAKNNLIFWKDYKNFDLKLLEKIDFNGKNIWIAFRKGFLTEKQIKDLIEFLLEKNIKKIILIPHSFHKLDENSNDYIFLEKFLEKKLSHPWIPSLKTKGRRLEKENQIEICKNMEESYEIYKKKKIDINFAMRLHSIILSEVYNIDYIGISYTKKTENILLDLEK